MLVSNTYSPLDFSPKDGRLFTRTLVVSILVHFAAAGFLLQHGQRAGERVATYLDLSMVSPASPVAEPQQVTPVDPSEPEPPVSEPEQPDAALPQDSPYDTMQKQVNEALQAGEAETESLDRLSFSLGMTDGYFSTLAEGKTLRPDIREYYLSLLQKVNEMWWLRRNRQEQAAGGAIVNIVIARDGTVVHLELARGSVNPERDKEMLQILRSAGPLPPLPATYEDQLFKAPIRFVAPLGLMIPGLPKG